MRTGMLLIRPLALTPNVVLKLYLSLHNWRLTSICKTGVYLETCFVNNGYSLVSIVIDKKIDLLLGIPKTISGGNGFGEPLGSS